MKRVVTSGLVVLAAACGETTTNPVQQLNLDRPIDLAFACYGGLRLTGGGAPTPDQPITTTAQPLEACVIRSGPRDGTQVPVPPGQEDLTAMGGLPLGNSQFYAFILQSTPGTVAIARFDTKPTSLFGGGDVIMLDADPLTPGKNSIAVGEDPIAIVADRVGCQQVIANAGSCDLSILDVNSALDFDLDHGADVYRMDVKNAAGEPIRARPAALVMEPPGGTIGEVCAKAEVDASGTVLDSGARGLAYIAYPSCRLVAGVDVSTGTIVTGIQFDASGVPAIVDGTVTCPNECDGTDAITPGVRPVALDLELDPWTSRRVLAIGADNSNVLTMYELDAQYRPLSALPVALEDERGNLGVTSVSISPVIGIGGTIGAITDEGAPGGEHQYVYAVATDGSVRVADISGAPRECDTQVDPRYLRDVRDIDRLACLRVGDPATPPRRANARGPGIELLADAIPTSIDIFRIEPVAGDSRPPGTPARMIGYFGVITATNGQSYLLNIDDDDFADFVDPLNPLGSPIPKVIANQLRDNIPERGLLAEDNGQLICNTGGPDPDAQTGNRGGPRLVGNVSRNVPSGLLAPQKFGGLPSIRQVLCQGLDSERPVSELAFAAPIAVREEVFPDLRALRAPDETWSLTWEGSLSNDGPDVAVDGPVVRQGTLFVDAAGMRLRDDTRPFCHAGVEPYDIVQLRGCDPSLGDIGCPAGYTCYVHPQSQIQGLGACMLHNEAERLANACQAFLTSLRRYTVGTTSAGELTLLPRKNELRTTPLDGCIDDDHCQVLGTYALSNPSTANPRDDQTAPDTRRWACQVDPDRRPRLDSEGEPIKRCLLTCDTAAECPVGNQCTAHPGAAPRAGYCMEGVIPPQSCVNAPQRYELRAGEAFALLGTRSGFQHPLIADAGGSCVRDPDANPYLVGRVPLRAPPCDPAADPRTGQLPDGTFEPNPCQLTVDETEYQLNYVPGTCSLGDPDESIVTRSATALRIRHRSLTLTLVDPTYPGDAMCHGDRGGALGDVPLVASGFQIAFRQTAGFLPLLLPIKPSFPIKVARGPLESIWVVDQGDFLSTSISQPSTRGRVFRIESSAIARINLLE
jgi:hypothetical protein